MILGFIVSCPALLIRTHYLRIMHRNHQDLVYWRIVIFRKVLILYILISIGAMILSTYPLICSPISQRIPSICHYCFKRFRTLSRCSRCKLVRYCSKQCQVADWYVRSLLLINRKYHKVECPVFKILSNMVDVDVRIIATSDL